jgi:hypothetical protein
MLGVNHSEHAVFGLQSRTTSLVRLSAEIAETYLRSYVTLIRVRVHNECERTTIALCLKLNFFLSMVLRLLPSLVGFCRVHAMAERWRI